MAVDCTDCAAKGNPYAIARDGTILHQGQQMADGNFVLGEANRDRYAAGDRSMRVYTRSDVVLCSSCTGTKLPLAGTKDPNAAAQTGGNIGATLSQIGEALGKPTELLGISLPLWAWGGGAYVALQLLGGGGRRRR